MKNRPQETPMTKRLDEKGRLLLLTSLRASRICRDNLLLEWHNRNQNTRHCIQVLAAARVVLFVVIQSFQTS